MAEWIRMSEATALGLHTMAAVARSAEPEPTVRIAEELNASETHLAKVLQQLVRAELLTSKRGPSGGYTLAKPASKIRLLDVYETLEGPFRRDGCLFAEPICRRVRCVLADLVKRLRVEAYDHLASTSLADIIDGVGR